MPVASIDSLRIRLEGRLETLEEANALLRELVEHASPRRWQGAPLRVLELLGAWEALQTGLDEAREHVRAHGELVGLDSELERFKRSLARALAFHNAPLASVADLGLKLTRWRQVIGPFAQPVGPLLLEGKCRLRMPHLFKSLASVVIVAASPLPLWAMGIAAGLAYAGLLAAMWPAQFRLYGSCLELAELGRAPIRVPLQLINRVEWNVVTLELDGLWRLTLVSDDSRKLGELAVRLRQLRALPHQPDRA